MLSGPGFGHLQKSRQFIIDLTKIVDTLSYTDSSLLINTIIIKNIIHVNSSFIHGNSRSQNIFVYT